VGGIFVNMVRPKLDESIDHVDVSELVLGLKAAGLPDAPGLAESLAHEVAEQAHRVELEERERAELSAARIPMYDLPLLPDGADLTGLYELAEAMRDQGAA
jgi:hypothetical protein